MLNKHGIKIIGKDEKIFGANIECVPDKDSMLHREDDRQYRYPVLKKALEQINK